MAQSEKQKWRVSLVRESEVRKLREKMSNKVECESVMTSIEIKMNNLE